VLVPKLFTTLRGYDRRHFTHDPPIHVIVENGHVTLDGVVNSNTDRMLARSIASSFGAFSVTNDLKTDSEVEQELEHL